MEKQATNKTHPRLPKNRDRLSQEGISEDSNRNVQAPPSGDEEVIDMIACPDCGKQWSEKEQEFQQCDKCGYPLPSSALRLRDKSHEDGHYEGDWGREMDDDLYD
jgi:DNA-directed RNA polymerase subunit M/transcription elongation factor TFIIS